MRRSWPILLVGVLGCSTSPTVDFLDYWKPGRMYSDRVQRYGGVCQPQGAPLGGPLPPTGPVIPPPLAPGLVPNPGVVIPPPPGTVGPPPPGPLVPARASPVNLDDAFSER